MAIIYMATNTVTGMSYIGSTDTVLDQRRRGHFGETKRGSKTPFHTAIREFGPESFIWRILKSDIFDKEKVQEEEARLIAVFETFIDGYNATRSGKGGGKDYSSPHTEETKRKISDIKKKYFAENPNSIQTRRKISEGLKKSHTENPQSHSEETKIKLSELARRRGTR